MCGKLVSVLSGSPPLLLKKYGGGGGGLFLMNSVILIFLWQARKSKRDLCVELKQDVFTVFLSRGL
jgi:hypothetical protein